MGRMELFPYPAQDDIAGWKSMIADREQMMGGFLAEAFERLPVHGETISVDGVTVYVLSPDRVAVDDPRVYLDIHGGALITGSGDSCRGMGAMAAVRNQTRTWSVDYRMPPDHPFPAALDDCLTVYRTLLREHRPEHSFQANLGVDSVLTESLMPANLLYAGGHDLADPYLSPLFGDFTRGFPPTFLSTGTRDLFLSNTVRLHRALRNAGVPAELHVMEAAPHGGFLGSSPEDAEIGGEVRRFIDEHCRDARPT